MTTAELSALIRAIPDFPRPGIIFRDITPLLADARALRAAVDHLAGRCPAGLELVAGIESRGFIFGAAVAARLGVGFVPIRKKGKLPAATVAVSYDLEYGRDTVEIHRDALAGGRRVVLIDDLLATGGTAAAAGQLVEKAGGTLLDSLFLIELKALNGRARLAPRHVETILAF